MCVLVLSNSDVNVLELRGVEREVTTKSVLGTLMGGE
jgi:hypothetical protein